MKRLTALWLLALEFCLLSSAAFSEAGQPLFAVRDENGLWGYIDTQGTLVIPGTYTYAEDFRGEYAEVFVWSEDGSAQAQPMAEDLWRLEGHGGIINRKGEWVLPPGGFDILSQEESGGYAGGRDTGIYLITGVDPALNQTKFGYFDIPSGYYSGIIYDDIGFSWWSDLDPELICVIRDQKAGFVRRSTGETVNPFQFEPGSWEFSGESCLVRKKDTAGWILIDRQGREIPLPEGVCADGTLSDGLASVMEPDSALSGYADAAGALVIPTKYSPVLPFREERAFVRTAEGIWQLIDREGNTVWTCPEDGWVSHFSCSQGHFCIWDRSTGECVCYDLDGRETFRLQISGLSYVGGFMENGVAFYTVGPGPDIEETGKNMGLLNLMGEVLTAPCFLYTEEMEDSEYADGLMPMVEHETLRMGYVDEHGQWAIGPVDGFCEPFREGLGIIHLYPDMLFVDREGNEVYRYQLW